MNWIVMLCVILVSALAQMLLPALAGQMKFPFLMGAVLYYALHRSAPMTGAAALLAGGMQDLLGATPLGLSVLLLLGMGLVAERFRKVVITESWLSLMIFGAGFGAAVSVGTGVFLQIAGLASVRPSGLLVRAGGGLALGGLCTCAVARLAGALDAMAGNVSRKVEVHGVQ